MPNHWHLVVSPEVDGEMSRFGQWLGLTHTQHYNAHYQTTGEGHLYQGRYKSFPVQSDAHFLSVYSWCLLRGITMGRAKRAVEAGAIYHMLNRANRRATIPHKAADCEAFDRVNAAAIERGRDPEVYSYLSRLTRLSWHTAGFPNSY